MGLGGDEYWDVPWVIRHGHETLKETAERAVLEKCGSGLEFNVLGNAPGSFYKYKYPSWYQEKVERKGVKVWLFKAYLGNDYLNPPQVKLDENLIDYKWVTMNEMQEHLDK